MTDIEHVHLIYISKDREENLVEIYDRIEGKNILLVSEAYDDKRIIMINFFETKDKKVLFEINKANIINQGLAVLPDMVFLGGTEIDVAEIYRESQQSLRGLQKQLENLQQRQKELQGRVEAGNIEMEQQQQLIEFQTMSIDSQKNELKVQKVELRNLFAEIAQKQDTLNRKTQVIIVREKEIEKGNLTLSEQQTKIDIQNVQIDKQVKTLEKQVMTISTQQNVLYLLGFILLLILILILAIHRGYRKNKKANKLISEQKFTLEKTLKQLQAANKELEAFSYSISHDLRAPLRAIDGFTRILIEEHASKLNKEGKRLGSIIQDNAKNMGQLIDDLLSFSRLGRTSLIYSKIDMKKIVNAIYHEATIALERKRIKFTVAKLPNVEGDPTMMHQVWMNLISNAVKFSSNRKQAVISVTCQEEENKLTYCIKDNGAGFDMKYVDKLFGVFQRLHSKKEFKGTGVGLALVQRIILRHGGKVWAEGNVDKGATFYFSLPKKGGHKNGI